MKKKMIVMCLIVTIGLLSCNNENLDKKQNEDNKVQKDSMANDQSNLNDSNAVSFEKTLTLQGITYQLATTGKGSIRKLTIVPSGLKGTNDKIALEVDPIVGAEIEDLDRDGFPELLVYTQSAGSGSYGMVVGFSPNKGKTLSQIYFPDLEKGSEAMKGYMGHDEFAIVESTLMRRFKTYEDNDTNAKPTGKMRQIEYKLNEGEASKKFVMGKTTDIALQ